MIRNANIRHFLRLRYAKLSTETNVARTKEGEFEWHTDHINHREPARLSILHALATPDAGGDTLFACMFSAYDALCRVPRESRPRRSKQAGRRALHTPTHQARHRAGVLLPASMVGG